MTDDSDKRRRSRRRATAQQGPPPPVAPSTPDHTPPDPTPPDPMPEPARVTRVEPPRPKKAKAQGGRTSSPRGERDLAGPGTSQVGPTGAMRARDLNRPTAADLAEAEAELDIVRRHWAPVTEAVVAETPKPYRAPGRRRK